MHKCRAMDVPLHACPVASVSTWKLLCRKCIVLLTARWCYCFGLYFSKFVALLHVSWFEKWVLRATVLLSFTAKPHILHNRLSCIKSAVWKLRRNLIHVHLWNLSVALTKVNVPEMMCTAVTSEFWYILLFCGVSTLYTLSSCLFVHRILVLISHMLLGDRVKKCVARALTVGNVMCCPY